MRGIEPRAFHMQSERSTTELHPLGPQGTTKVVVAHSTAAVCRSSTPTYKNLPTGGLEPPIFGLGDRRLIH